MRGVIFFAGLLLVFSGCARSYRDCALYQSSGKAKPIIAVLPVIDASNSNKVNWSISEELTQKIQKRIVDSSKLYLLKDKGNMEMARLLNNPDPSQLPETIGKSLGAAEFVIVAELIDQDEAVFGHPSAEEKPYLAEIAGNIHLAMRVRVLDVRDETPKLILQEVVCHDHEVSRPYLNVNYDKYHWGQEAYERTPLGLSHNKIVRELVAHVEGYIGATRS